MKKMAQEKVIELLKNKKNYTYKKLAKLTGYHQKSLIRIYSKLKNKNYNLKENQKLIIKREIVDNYLSSKYTSF